MTTLIKKSIVPLMGLFLALVVNPCFGSHPYHVSYAEVEWNQQTGNFEVALCVWPSDLEKAIATQEKKSVDLDDIEELDSLLEKYVSEHFHLRSNKVVEGKTSKDAAPIRWVGHEKDLKKAWLYFEVIGDKEGDAWSLENKVFFELNEDQSNHLQITTGDSVSNLVCNSATRKHNVSTSLKSQESTLLKSKK